MKNLKLNLINIFFAISIFGTGTAFANDGSGGQRIVLEYNQNTLYGQNTLYLEREIQRQHPEINLQNISLEYVRLYAKTDRGYGTAQLVVGSSQTRAAQVRGNLDDFNDSSFYTFDRINFSNPSRYNQNLWQIRLVGTFKVLQIVIRVKQNDGGFGGFGGSGGMGPRPNF